MKRLALSFLMILLLFGIIACNNEEPYDPRYARLSDIDYLVVKNTSSQYGFIDSDFKEVIPCKFNSVTFFTNGLSIVQNSDHKYGIINTDGIYVVGAKYDSIQGINNFQYFIVEKNNLYALMNARGTELTDFKYSEIKVGDYEPIIAVRGTTIKKWGYINLSGDQLAGFIYDDVYAFNGRQITAVKKNNNWRIINAVGDYLNSTLYDNVFMSSINNLISVKVGDKWGLIDKSGVYVLPIIYKFYFRFNEYGISPINKEGLYGFVDEEGNVVEDILYTSEQFKYFPMYLSFPNVVVFNRDQKYIIFDYNGNKLFSSVRYRPIDYNENFILAEDMIKHQEKVINYNGKILGPANEDITYKILPYFENFFFAEHFVTRDTVKTYVSDVYNIKGKLLTEDKLVKYDKYITNYSRKNYIPIQYLDLGAYGLMNEKGDMILEPKYRWIRVFDDGYIIAKKDNLVCIMDLKGNIILDYKYSDIIYQETDL